MKLTKATLDRAVYDAYCYAHENCHYGPTDRAFPPGSDYYMDCCGLVFRALYTLDLLKERKNINQIPEVCLAAGLELVKDANEFTKRGGVACFQDKHLKGTANISHVFYVFARANENPLRVMKCDTGSETRLRTAQPYKNALFDEWPTTRNFLFGFCIPEEPDTKDFEGKTLFTGVTRKNLILRAVAGAGNESVCAVHAGQEVSVIAAVTTVRENVWFYVRWGEVKGWLYRGALSYSRWPVPKNKVRVKALLDGFLSCRVGAGVAWPLFKARPSCKEGSVFRVVTRCTANDGSEWINVMDSKHRFYFISAIHTAEKEK